MCHECLACYPLYAVENISLNARGPFATEIGTGPWPKLPNFGLLQLKSTVNEASLASRTIHKPIFMIYATSKLFYSKFYQSYFGYIEYSETSLRRTPLGQIFLSTLGSCSI